MPSVLIVCIAPKRAQKKTLHIIHAVVLLFSLTNFIVTEKREAGNITGGK